MRRRLVAAVRAHRPLYELLQRLRMLALSMLDLLDAATGRRPELMPPRRFRLVGRGDFENVGRQLVRHLVELADLRPGDAVLDIGCGSGRVAVPLLDFLDANGEYRGFDVVPDWIRWCSENITPRNHQFQFTLADLYNGKYNPTGKVAASAYRFPYEADSFTVAFATSVFTHLKTADLSNYLRETARVLAPGGRFLSTFFVLNETSLLGANEGRAAINFPHRLNRCYVSDPSLPELAVAYEEQFLRDLHREHGLEILDPIHYGWWSGRPDGRARQDILVARRRR